MRRHLALLSSIVGTLVVTAVITSAARCTDDAGQVVPTPEPTRVALSTPTAPATPGTWRPDSTASSVEDAASFGRDVILTTFGAHAVRELEYTETTVGALRQLFGPSTTGRLDDAGAKVETLQAEDDWSVWAIRARGAFQAFHMGLATQPPPLEWVWILVLRDRAGLTWFATNSDHDLSQLGDVGQVSLPVDWGPVHVEPPLEPGETVPSP